MRLNPPSDEQVAPEPPRPRGLIHYLWLGLSGGLLALVILVGALAVGVPMVTGSAPMTILTGSMAPHYPPGTLVIVRPTPVDDIRVGDIITYQLHSGEPEVVTHRVVAIALTGDQLTFTTQGDANPSPDPAPVMPVQIRGTLWYAIPYLGYVNTWINGPYRGWIVAGVAVLLFGYAAYAFIGSALGAARRRRVRRTAADGGVDPS